MTNPRVSPVVLEVLEVLGASIRAERVRRRWSAAELAERVGVSRPTITKIEQGAPSVAVGTVLEAAHLVGVPLFESDEARRRYGAHRRAELALLPAAAHRRRRKVDDDF